MTVWAVILIAGRLFSAEATSFDDCMRGSIRVQAWAIQNHYNATITCQLSKDRPRGSTDFLEWVRKGDA